MTFTISKEKFAEMTADRLQGDLTALNKKDYQIVPDGLNRTEYMVVGPSSPNGQLQIQSAYSRDMAMILAKLWAKRIDREVFVFKYEGSFNAGK